WPATYEVVQSATGDTVVAPVSESRAEPSCSPSGIVQAALNTKNAPTVFAMLIVGSFAQDVPNRPTVRVAPPAARGRQGCRNDSVSGRLPIAAFSPRETRHERWTIRGPEVSAGPLGGRFAGAHTCTRRRSSASRLARLRDRRVAAHRLLGVLERR